MVSRWKRNASARKSAARKPSRLSAYGAASESASAVRDRLVAQSAQEEYEALSAVGLPPPPPKPTRAQVIEFYKTKGAPQHAGQTDDGQFCPWFHGIITRADADLMLEKEQDGTFLVRLAESRRGYRLHTTVLATIHVYIRR